MSHTKQKKILIISETIPERDIWWELPGGKISKADRELSPIESLSRELVEELGSDFGILSGNPTLFMVHKSYEEITFSDSRVPFMFLCYLFEIDRDFPIILSHEHSEYRWISEADMADIEGWRGGFDSIVSHAFSYAAKA